MASESDQDTPKRCIFNDVDMNSFVQSSTKKELLNFVEAMGKSCASGEATFDPKSPLSDLTPSMASLHGSLQQMITWIADFPPIDRDQTRFGNPSFRQWHSRLLDRSNAIITAILQARDGDLSPEEASRRGWEAAAGTFEAKEDPSIVQVSCYLHDSFGHATRLDYGTGHESSFAVFLLVLSKVKCMGEKPSVKTMNAVAISIFDAYLQLTRRLQNDYFLEPAGSHGVWGLDDYHCLPFYFGACQLQVKGTTPLELAKPTCIADESLLTDYGDRFLYLSCIRYIRQLKKGVPFFESSPMLYDISQTLPTWDKVARGMIRLYEGEVLEKRQVVQHFVFGKFFNATWKPSQTQRSVPTETFRDPAAGNSQLPVTRAPWATKPTPGSGPMPTTRAPWATNSAPGAAPMPVTRAPWAKDNQEKK